MGYNLKDPLRFSISAILLEAGFSVKNDLDRSDDRLTKAYGITLQRCRKSDTKVKVSKMHIVWCMGLNFCVKFKGALWKFT